MHLMILGFLCVFYLLISISSNCVSYHHCVLAIFSIYMLLHACNILFCLQIDHCMEKHQQECRRAQRHQPNCHKSNNKRENDNGSSRFTGAWWSVITDSNGNGYNSASLADAPLSPKVYALSSSCKFPLNYFCLKAPKFF